MQDFWTINSITNTCTWWFSSTSSPSHCEQGSGRILPSHTSVNGERKKLNSGFAMNPWCVYFCINIQRYVYIYIYIYRYVIYITTRSKSYLSSTSSNPTNCKKHEKNTNPKQKETQNLTVFNVFLLFSKNPCHVHKTLLELWYHPLYRTSRHHFWVEEFPFLSRFLLDERQPKEGSHHPGSNPDPSRKIAGLMVKTSHPQVIGLKGKIPKA